jgi:hypothetical protein
MGSQEEIACCGAGLKDFNRYVRVDAEGLAKIIESSPNFFRAFRKLRELYPPAAFPDTYFIVGQMRGGGTDSFHGLLIEVEMYARSPDVPTTELGDSEKGVILEQSEIPPTIAHEFIHFHQAFSSQESLLCKCLNEGRADFIGELISGRLITATQKTHAWASPREQQLWGEFQKEMGGTDISHWLYAGSGKGDRPGDLGYKITEAYYRRAADKNQAIRDILMVKDCNEFLKASRYAEKFVAASNTLCDDDGLLFTDNVKLDPLALAQGLGSSAFGRRQRSKLSHPRLMTPKRSGRQQPGPFQVRQNLVRNRRMS